MTKPISDYVAPERNATDAKHKQEDETPVIVFQGDTTPNHALALALKTAMERKKRGEKA